MFSLRSSAVKPEVLVQPVPDVVAVQQVGVPAVQPQLPLDQVGDRRLARARHTGRRDRIELKNQADALAFQAERSLEDLGDKIDATSKSDIEGQISALREAITSEDDASIRTSMDALQQALYALSQQAYSADDDGEDGGTNGRPQDEGVVEGEYTVD